jgi:murein DD-endopeptidase MepM/ murein hydrolase activator NlpD
MKPTEKFRSLAFFLFSSITLHVSAAPLESYTPTAGVTLTGRFIQGGLVSGRCDKPCQVALEGKRVEVSPDKYFVIGFGRDAPALQAFSVTFREGEKPVHASLRVQKRSYPVERIKGVPQATVEPPPEVTERILREQVLVENARKTFTRLEYHRTQFDWPAQGRVSGVFGSQRVYNGVPKTPHNGMDIAAPIGAPVHAPVDGVVTLAERDLFFSGGTLIVDHGHGVFSTFIHLSDILVKPGDAIRRGDLIAKVGMTGRATGPHLHWSLNWFNERLDPQLLMTPR